MIKGKKLSSANCDPGGASGKGRSAEGGKEREITAGEKEQWTECEGGSLNRAENTRFKGIKRSHPDKGSIQRPFGLNLWRVRPHIGWRADHVL